MTERIKKNTEFRWVFHMELLVGGNGSGKPVVVEISQDGGAFAAADDSPATEISDGWYYCDMTAAEWWTSRNVKSPNPN